MQKRTDLISSGLSKEKIHLRPGTTDLRKAVNGLSMIVQETMEQDPFSGSVFLFFHPGEAMQWLLKIGEIRYN